MFNGTVGVDLAKGAGTLAGKPDGFAIGIQAYAMRCSVYGFVSAFGMYFYVDRFRNITVIIQPGHFAMKFQRYPQPAFAVDQQAVRAAAFRHFVIGKPLALVVK